MANLQLLGALAAIGDVEAPNLLPALEQARGGAAPDSWHQVGRVNMLGQVPAVGESRTENPLHIG
jgi:hypothetical protein